MNLANEINIVYQDVKFLVYPSAKQLHISVSQLDNVKRELEDNDLLIATFGVLKPERSSGYSWSEDYVELTKWSGLRCVVVEEEQIRGLNVGFHAPDCIIVDDVEDEESVSRRTDGEGKSMVLQGASAALPQMTSGFAAGGRL